MPGDDLMKTTMLKFRTLIAVILGVLTASVSAQQDYPNKPIRIIVPFPPGGGPSILARIFGDKLTQSWG